MCEGYVRGDAPPRATQISARGSRPYLGMSSSSLCSSPSAARCACGATFLLYIPQYVNCVKEAIDSCRKDKVSVKFKMQDGNT